MNALQESSQYFARAEEIARELENIANRQGFSGNQKVKAIALAGAGQIYASLAQATIAQRTYAETSKHI